LFVGQFLIRVEAVNLSSSIFDTDDLSVIRGGGVANLLLPSDILKALNFGEIIPVFSGASQAEAVLSAGPGVTERMIEQRLAELISGKRQLDVAEPEVLSVLRHLVLIGVAVPFEAGYAKANRHAMGRVRQRQLNTLTLDRGDGLASSVRRPCVIDGFRPAATLLSKGGKDLLVSASVRDRQALGRKLRQRIYHKIGIRTDRTLRFADSFSDLVEGPPDGVPPSLVGKMAVVYLDGNKFTAARDGAIQRDPNGGHVAAAAFSQCVTAARAQFLDRLLDRLEKDKRMFFEGRLRFEILMWGGDEARFVLPAWKVRDLLDLLTDDMEQGKWDFDGQRLTNAVGILVCHHKMPIAKASDLANQVVDEAKLYIKTPASERQDVLSLQLIESIEPPMGGLKPFREKLYRTAEPDVFCVAGPSRIRSFLAAYDRITDPQKGLPRSQLYDLISEARRPVAQNTERKNPKELNELIGKAVKRTKGNSGEDTLSKLRDALHDPAFVVSETAPFAGLVRMAEMWDLMRPFETAPTSDVEAA
jgi:hypothetical protein